MRTVRSLPVLATLAALVATSAMFGAGAAHAAGPAMGTADNFALLAATTITNTGPTTVTGDLGLHPGSAVVGFGGAPDGTVNGTMHITDAVALQAKTDLIVAYDDAAGRALTATAPPDIGGQTLVAGVYRTGGVPTMTLTGTVTLDAEGDPDAVFIFQVASALITATDSSVNLINGAQSCNVYWQVGSDVTLGTRTAFVGTVLALNAIAVSDAVVVDGALLARNAAVTLINDTITRATCAPPPIVPPDDDTDDTGDGGSDDDTNTDGTDDNADTGGSNDDTSTGNGSDDDADTAGPGSETGAPTGSSRGELPRTGAPHQLLLAALGLMLLAGGLTLHVLAHRARWLG